MVLGSAGPCLLFQYTRIESSSDVINVVIIMLHVVVAIPSPLAYVISLPSLSVFLIAIRRLSSLAIDVLMVFGIDLIRLIHSGKFSMSTLSKWENNINWSRVCWLLIKHTHLQLTSYWFSGDCMFCLLPSSISVRTFL